MTSSAAIGPVILTRTATQWQKLLDQSRSKATNQPAHIGVLLVDPILSPLVREFHHSGGRNWRHGNHSHHSLWHKLQHALHNQPAHRMADQRKAYPTQFICNGNGIPGSLIDRKRSVTFTGSTVTSQISEGICELSLLQVGQRCAPNWCGRKTNSAIQTANASRYAMLQNGSGTAQIESVQLLKWGG